MHESLCKLALVFRHNNAQVKQEPFCRGSLFMTYNCHEGPKPAYNTTIYSPGKERSPKKLQLRTHKCIQH